MLQKLASAQWWSSWKHRIFGNHRLGAISARLGVDLLLGSAAILIATVARLIATHGLVWESDIGTVLQKIGNGFAHNAPGFLSCAALLFTLSGLYRPLPSGRVVQRLTQIAQACLLGLLCHVFLHTMVLHREFLSRGIVYLGWFVLFLMMIGIRGTRMWLGARFRIESRTPRNLQPTEAVLVVGGAGYIGSVLTHQLLEAGYRVRVLDLFLFGRNPLTDLHEHPRLEMMEGDFRNVEDVVRALRGMDAVIHLAAIVGDPACAVDQETTIAVNYGAARMIAQLSRAQGISRFLFASTCSVYGAGEQILDENGELNPVSLYATTKIDAERALLEATDHIFQPTILRLSTAYGWSYRPRFDLVANLLSAQAVTDKKITIFNGQQWRPFVHTKDIGRAFVMALEAPLSLVGGEIFNVGDDGQNFTLSELGETIAARVPGTVVEHRSNNEDPRNYRVSFEKIKQRLNFRATIPLADGVEEMIEAVKNGLVENWRSDLYNNVRHLKGEGLEVLQGEVSKRLRINDMVATMRFLAKAG